MHPISAPFIPLSEVRVNLLLYSLFTYLEVYSQLLATGTQQGVSLLHHSTNTPLEWKFLGNYQEIAQRSSISLKHLKRQHGRNDHQPCYSSHTVSPHSFQPSGKFTSQPRSLRSSPWTPTLNHGERWHKPKVKILNNSFAKANCEVIRLAPSEQPALLNKLPPHQ